MILSKFRFFEESITPQFGWGNVTRESFPCSVRNCTGKIGRHSVPVLHPKLHGKDWAAFRSRVTSEIARERLGGIPFPCYIRNYGKDSRATLRYTSNTINLKSVPFPISDFILKSMKFSLARFLKFFSPFPS